MAQREKLIELMLRASMDMFNIQTESIEIIADYLITNGVFVLPCKVGDTVYVTDLVFGKASPCEVSCFNAIENGEVGTIEYKVSKDIPNIVSVECSCEEIGKTVFLTREAAEAALKKMEGEK